MLGYGEELRIGDEFPQVKVDIFDTTIALAKLPLGRGVYVGQAKLVLNGPSRYWTWLGNPRFISKGEIVLHSESISTNKRQPEIVWRQK